MSWLKTIFGKKLGVEAFNRARSVRVSLGVLHRIHFRPDQSTLKLQLLNISVGGMALIHDDHVKAKVGQEVSGILNIDEVEHPLHFIVRHQNDQILGCQFVGQDPSLSTAIENYLRGEILAMKLKRVNERYVKPDPRGKVLWFTDGQHNEIYCVLDPKGVVSFHMSFLGNYIEGDLLRGVRTGHVRDLDHHADPGHKGSILLLMEKETPEATLNLARTIVQSVDAMPEQTQADLIRLIDQSAASSV